MGDNNKGVKKCYKVANSCKIKNSLHENIDEILMNACFITSGIIYTKISLTTVKTGALCIGA